MVIILGWAIAQRTKFFKSVFAIVVAVLSAWSVGYNNTENAKIEEAVRDSGFTVEETTHPETIRVVYTKGLSKEGLESMHERELSESESQSEAESIAAANTKTDNNTHHDEEVCNHFTHEIEDDDLYYLAAAICNEAGGDSEEIQLLVANVILNRVNSSHYPNSIYGVLTQKYQYGMMWKYGISFPSWADSETRSRCYNVASRILSGERVCPPGVVYQAEFEQGSGIYEYYDGFYFCYE